MPSASALADVTITNAGGLNPQRVAGAGLRCSWGISQAGTMSVFLPARDAVLAGLGDTAALGRWLAYEHPTAGRWAGIVQDVSWAPNELELACESFHALLRKRRGPRNFRRNAMTPGEHFRRVITDASHDDPLWLTVTRADEDGEPVPMEDRGGDLFGTVIPQLLGGGDYEWRVNENREAEFGVAGTVGLDKRATVLLAEGRHIATFRYAASRLTVANDLLGIAGDKDYERAQSFIREDGASIERYGRLQETRVYPRLTSKSTIEPRLRAELRQTATPAAAVELTLTDEDRCFSWFREGDIVGVLLPTANAAKAVRLTARALDVEAGTLTCSGNVVGGAL